MKKLLTITILLLTLTTPLYATDLESTGYKIQDATLSSSGEITESTNFSVLSTVGEFSADPRNYSTNYSIKRGPLEIFTANIPLISCFETTTDGSSNCTTGPTYLNTNGMTTVCGPTGCYNSARFEIDEQLNPSDTLYGVQISTDNFTSNIQYIDGTTKKPKEEPTINDYLTKTDWETPVTNIKGLQSNTQYDLRITALHGDFTESSPSPTQTATTSSASLIFDIDIANESGTSTETSPPYNITFSNETRLVQTGPARSSTNLIWLDAQTNGSGGFAIVQKGSNGGLYSPTTLYTINSTTTDLDGTIEGFGLQSFYTAQQYEDGSGNGALASITTLTDYTNSGNNVGQISTSFSKVYESDGPVKSGRVGLKLKARASAAATQGTDYTEEITFIMVPKF
jgi:hypothetical protein